MVLGASANLLKVFETLSGLKIPDFGRGNWQSTIRGELALHEHYTDMANWRGRETADIVYKDCDGSLTRWLRQNCTGGFPEQIADDHHFAAYPIEYYLEVKSTTGTCSSRFFLSSGQYKRVFHTFLFLTRMSPLMKSLDASNDAARGSATKQSIRHHARFRSLITRYRDEDLRGSS
jgi:hypothetical protein